MALNIIVETIIKEKNELQNDITIYPKGTLIFNREIKENGQDDIGIRIADGTKTWKELSDLTSTITKEIIQKWYEIAKQKSTISKLVTLPDLNFAHVVVDVDKNQELITQIIQELATSPSNLYYTLGEEGALLQIKSLAGLNFDLSEINEEELLINGISFASAEKREKTFYFQDSEAREKITIIEDAVEQNSNQTLENNTEKPWNIIFSKGEITNELKTGIFSDNLIITNEADLNLYQENGIYIYEDEASNSIIENFPETELGSFKLLVLNDNDEKEEQQRFINQVIFKEDNIYFRTKKGLNWNNWTPLKQEQLAIIDGLNSTDTNKALSANQGKILNDSKVFMSQQEITLNKDGWDGNEEPFTYETNILLSDNKIAENFLITPSPESLIEYGSSLIYAAAGLKDGNNIIIFKAKTKPENNLIVNIVKLQQSIIQGIVQ